MPKPERKPTTPRGRPRTGKRSDPDYKQVSAWIRRDTHDRVLKRLFLYENKREFSDLVEALLQGWLKAPKKATDK